MKFIGLRTVLAVIFLAAPVYAEGEDVNREDSRASAEEVETPPTYEDLEAEVAFLKKEREVLEKEKRILKRVLSSELGGLRGLKPENSELLRSIGIPASSYDWYQNLPGNM